MDTAFRLRYRVQQADGTRRALVLEDPEGIFYLFSGGRLQVRLGPFSAWQRVSRSLSRARYAWQVVEGGVLHSLEALPLLEAQADGAKDGAGVQIGLA